MKRMHIPIFCLFILSLNGEAPNDPHNGYKPFGNGGFFISNSNSQTTHEVVHIKKKKPSKYTHPAPRTTPQPSYTPPANNPVQPMATLHETKKNDYFSYYATHMTTVPHKLCTMKNTMIVAGVLLCSYAYVYYKLMRYARNVKKNTGWGSFQEHIPPLQLSTIEPLALAEGIIEEIKSRYPLINPSNLMPSLLLFNKDVEQELDELQHYINFCTWLKKYKLIALFPDQQKLIEKAQSKIQRLFLLREALMAWINTHVTKLMRNQPIPRTVPQTPEPCVAA